MGSDMLRDDWRQRPNSRIGELIGCLKSATVRAAAGGRLTFSDDGDILLVKLVISMSPGLAGKLQNLKGSIQLSY